LNTVLKQLTFINLTPHDINYCPDHGDTINFPASGKIARVATRSRPSGNGLFEEIGLNLMDVSTGGIEGLPAPIQGTIYIVSMPVGHSVKRSDVICPDTGPQGAIRSNGRIVGVRRFQRFL
jgi:hypothetical protein